MNKPKEYWIDGMEHTAHRRQGRSGRYSCWDFEKLDRAGRLVHVIEKSAYIKLIGRLDEAECAIRSRDMVLSDRDSTIVSLEEEIKCLRSVLSEWDQDKSCYVQMVKADDLARIRKGVV